MATKVKLIVDSVEQEFEFGHAERILRLEAKTKNESFKLPEDTIYEFIDGNLRKRSKDITPKAQD